MSFVGELWQVYVLLAVSIALSGSGFGGAILSPIVSSLIVSVGWRSAFLVLAAICMVAALPSRVQAVWHGRPRQGHGHHHLQAARKRGGGVGVRRSFLFAPFCPWPPWKPNGCSYHHSVSKAATGLRMIRFPPSLTDHVTRRGRRKADRLLRRRVWPNEPPYPRSVRRAAAFCFCAV